ncbi:MAG TPA: S-layer protein, partial [Gemmataceae bacterium]|nr:S-layer protein [Gemmataceae bacterium]
MIAIRARWAGLLALAALSIAGPAFAADAKRTAAPGEPAPPPPPAEVRALAVFPETVALKGGDDSRQLIITATLSGDRLADLTGDVKYEVADARVVRVTTSGRVVPIGNGATQITAVYGDKRITVPVKAERVGEDLPINFANQVVPIFTKLGCNSGGCHGKLAGQNGFRLSLIGSDPELDYMTLVKEGRGRRLLPSSPDNSLLLLKATGTAAHGGGKKLEIGSDEYKLIRRWIASGVPVGAADAPTV